MDRTLEGMMASCPSRNPSAGICHRNAPTLDLHEIQATVLRQRPAPYFGTHVLLRVDDAQAGRKFLRRLTPHIDSAANWWNAANAWLSFGITYAGLEALGVPAEFATELPRGVPRRDGGSRPAVAGRRGQRSEELGSALRQGSNPHRSERIQRFRGKVAARRSPSPASSTRASRASAFWVQDFGAQPGDLNSLGYKDGIDQPAIEGSGVDPLPGQGQPIKAGEFILGYPGEAGVTLPVPQPDILGRNGTYVGFRKYQSRVGAFNRFLRANGSTEAERELLAAKLVGRWRSGAPLTLAPDVDNPGLGADPQRNNDFNYSKDSHGLQAPFGCHIRRMNPRDTKLTRLTDVNIHRLIRRGTTYGPPYDPNAMSEQDDEVSRGAIFLFISARAMATIEFLQQEWINDGDFIGGDERDPIIGRQEEGATFTIPKAAGQTTHPWHRNIQRASRRRVLFHAEPKWIEVACELERMNEADDVRSR